MSSTPERLQACMTIVFPDLSEGEIRQASIDSVRTWDSLATVTLISLIEEEFALRIQPEEFEQIVSFESILKCLEGKGTISPRSDS
jgi:acyl carrier protein